MLAAREGLKKIVVEGYPEWDKTEREIKTECLDSDNELSEIVLFILCE